MLAVLLVAVSLGLSNFAASVGIGTAGTGPGTPLRVGIVFGVFEAGMPAAGLLLGRRLAVSLGAAARWLGAALLIAVGCYVLLQAARTRSGDRAKAPAVAGPAQTGPAQTGPAQAGPPRTGRLVVTGLALSLDNLAVGFALGTYHVSLVVTALILGITSVAMSLASLELGGRLGARTGEWSELISGLVLIGVGIAVAAGAL